MNDSDSKTRRGNIIMVFIALLGITVAFIDIYTSAQHRRPGNAIGAGIALFAFSLLLATTLAKMRLAATPVKPVKSTK